jgi:hypothetical protein
MTLQLHPRLDELNTLFKQIQADKAAHPETKLGYYYSVPSILNAYREGDLNFEDACALLKVNEEAIPRVEIQGDSVTFTDNHCTEHGRWHPAKGE